MRNQKEFVEVDRVPWAERGSAFPQSQLELTERGRAAFESGRVEVPDVHLGDLLRAARSRSLVSGRRSGREESGTDLARMQLAQALARRA